MSIKYNIKTAGPNLTSGEIQEIPFAKLTPTAVEYTENGEYTVNPPTGYDGLSTVSVTVDVPSPTLGTTTVDPTTSEQVINAPTGEGFSAVTVNGVTAAIDANITAGNIKKDVEILGVTGTFDPTPNLEATTADPSTSQQTITASTGYDGLSSVTINAVTAGIDANISAGNIKNGVEVLGVTGTYAPSLTSVTAGYTANGNYTINVPTGYDGMIAVELEIDVPTGGGGTDCVDWSDIGWTCGDVTNSGLTNDIAYTKSLIEEHNTT